MRRTYLLIVTVALLGVCLPARAHAQNIGAQQRSAFENIIIGEAYTFEVITLSGAAKKLTTNKITPADNAIKGEATSVILTVSAATTICFEGTTATVSVCHPFPAASTFMVYGTRTLKNMSLYSASASVNVTYCRSRGK
jgi:hypothetical protein